MKYRVKKQDGYYYPQHKFIGCWWNFTEGYHDYAITIRCLTLMDAIEVIQKDINSTTEKKQPQEPSKIVWETEG